jgi:diguanylate cyclase (GGDEF)-like protein/PAS domain S-box-containing protein
MKISQKILIIIALLLVLLLVVGNTMISSFVKNYLNSEEQQQMNSVAHTVASHILSREDSYLASVTDWSHWDDPYNYLEAKNPKFVEENITASTFNNLNLSIVMIYAAAQNTFTDKMYYNNMDGEFASFPLELENEILSYIKSGHFIEDESMLLCVDNQSYIIALSKITDSMKTQTANGVLVFGRLLDEEFIKTIQEETNTNIRLMNYSEFKKVASDNMYQEIQASGSASKLSDEKDTIYNYTLIQNDLNGKAQVFLSVNNERTFYREGLSKFIVLQIIYSVVIIMFSALFYLFMIKFVSRPISKITKEVSEISLNISNLADHPQKITATQKDEIGTLAFTINSMIDNVSMAQLNLLQSEEQFRIMFEEAPLGIGLFDFKTGKVLRLNRKFAEIIGRTKDEAIDLDWQTISHPDDMAENLMYREKMAAGEIDGFSMMKRYYKKDGSIIWINLTIALLDAANKDYARELCMIEDITERKMKEEEIVYLNYHDVLTGLYNRRFFEEEKKRLDTARQLPFSVIIGDLDGLKLINDGFGYASGDLLLIKAAKIMKDSCRAEEIVSRIGGDEFCILLPKANAEVARRVVKKILEICENTHVQISNRAIKPSISLGYATKVSEEEKMDEIVAVAEDSMRKRKLLNRKSVRSDLIVSIQATMLEKSHETAEHAERMAILSVAVGESLGLSDDELYELELAAKLHDIGKMSIDHQTLSKQEKLTDEEWITIRKHPEVGFRIAQSTSELAPISEYILSHHERWDGKGYPQGLKGEGIPLIARIVSIVDSFDAMTENRPYRPAMTKEDAIAEIIRNSGTQFDPSIVEYFVKVVQDVTYESI